MKYRIVKIDRKHEPYKIQKHGTFSWYDVKHYEGPDTAIGGRMVTMAFNTSEDAEEYIERQIKNAKKCEDYKKNKRPDEVVKIITQ